MRKLLFCLFVSFLNLFASAQSGTLDATFNSSDIGFGNGDGPSGAVKSAVLQSDGKILIIGGFTTYNGTARNKIARLNSDGSLDATFNPGTGPNSNIIAIALQGDGKILIGGGFTTYYGTARNRIARLNSDGSLDATFNPGSGANATVQTIVLQSDGKILMGGDFSSYNGTARNNLVRLNSDGSLDLTFNTGAGANNTITSIIQQGDGKILIGGYFSTYSGASRNYIARVNSDGTLDATFNPGTGADVPIYTLALQSDGKVVIGGGFTAYNGTARNRLARLNSNGTLDATFNPGTGSDGTVEAMALQGDGKILIGGGFGTYNGTARNYIARVNSDGTLDATFNPGTGANSYLSSINQQSDGKILIGGVFTAYNGISRKSIARLNSDGSLNLTLNPGTGANDYVGTMASQSDGKVVIVGNFTIYNGVIRNKIARLQSNGDLDATFNPGTGANAEIKAVAIQSDGKILIAGSFSSYNGTARNRIARLNSDGSLDATFNPGTGASSFIYSLVLQSDGKILIGGYFTTYNGTARNYIARLNSDGSLDATFSPGTGANDVVMTIALQSDGKILIAGGFTSYNGTARNYITRLNSNGSLDATFNPGTGADNYLYSLALQSDGKIVIGGNLTTYNGTSKNRIARLNSDGSLDATFNPGTGANNSVQTILPLSGGKIVIGGSFTTYNSTGRNHIVRLNSDGSLDATFNPGTGTNNNFINSLALQSDGNVVLGGDFTVYNGIGRNRIAKIDNTILPTITTNTVSQNSYCAGSTVPVSFTFTGAFTTSNTFTVQLSDASGNFASPVAIGTLNGNVSGTIVATIPTTITSGTGYRIRVVSSSPAVTGTDNGSNLTLTTTPTIDNLSNLVACNGVSVPATTFTGSVGANFTWTNSNTAIGIGASGSGNISAFTPVNATAVPITATLTVTPRVVNGSFAYVPAQASNNVTVVNLSNNTVVATIPVGNAPFSATPLPDRSYVYVTNSNSNTVSVINTATNSVTTTISVGTFPGGIAASPDGSRVYVVSNGANQLSTINTSTNTVVNTLPIAGSPWNIALSPDGSRAYVGRLSAGAISVIDLATNTQVASITVGSNPYSIVVSPDGSRAYAVNWSSNNVSVINTTTNTVVATIPGFTSPLGASISPDGSRLYVTNNSANTVSVVNTTNNTIIGTFTGFNAPIGINTSSDGSLLYVANNSVSALRIVNATTGVTTGSVPTGSSPYAYGIFTVNSQCTGTSKTFTITVNPQPAATIAYSAASFCATGTATVTRTGTAGGTYSSTSGLSINATTGSIDLGASTPGTYIVTYTIPASGGCAAVNATTRIQINALPVVDQPTNQTFCAGSATGAINFSGTAGNYTWTNSNTAIGLAASGSSTISSFAPVNNSTAPITSTITVTPVNSAEYAYVSGGAGISVINLRTNIQETEINTGGGPFGVAISPGGGLAYVARQSSNDVLVINTQTNTISATIPVGSTPYGIAISPDGNRVYVVNSSDNTVSVINTVTNVVIATVPVGSSAIGIAVSPNGSKVYVANRGSDNITVINTSTNTVSATIGNAGGPFGIAFSVDGTRMYVSNQFSNSVSIYNGTTDALITTIGVGSEPRGISVSPNGSRVYVANRVSGNVSVINTSTNSVVATVPVGAEAFGVSVSTDGSKAYAASFSTSTVKVINTATNAVSATISTSTLPIGFGNFIKTATNCSGTAQTFTITVNPQPAASISYTGSPYCQTGTATPTLSGTTGGSYSSSTGLSINATTGVIDLAASTPGTYPVTYTIAASGSCAQVQATTTVTIMSRAAITQPADIAVCAGTATSVVTFTGTNGSGFTWSNSNTAIGLAASGSGNLPTFTPVNNSGAAITVTITVHMNANAGFCAATAKTFTITVNPSPAASITGGTFCKTGTTTLAISGQSGGTFNAPAGLAITASTGQIDLAASTPGTYTVTYNFSNGTCYNSTTSNVSINALPSASISGGTFCNTGTTTLTVTGQGGGTFTSTAGLVLNSPTGQINLGTSVPGTYTVTYSFTNGTCSNTTTSTVTVNALPVAIISGGTFCKAGTKQLMVTSGQTGGSFSAPAGLDINATGLINLANSTPGTYTVTYTFTNGSCNNTTTSSVTVNPLPAATISGTTTICENATAPAITFTGSNSTAPYTFTYKINGGASQTVTTTSGNAVTVAVPTNTPGTFTYTLVSVKGATDCQATSSGSAIISVTAMPTAAFSYAGSPYCPSGNASPTVNGSTGGTYTSTTGLSINATTGAVNLAASTPGTYTITYTIAAAGGCAGVSSTASITIKEPLTIATQPASQTICQGTSATFSVTPSGTGPFAYQWRKNGLGILNANSASYTITNATNADVASYDVIVTGSCGAEASSPVILGVNGLTGITTQPTAKVVCTGSNATFTVEATGAGLSYQWRKGGVAISGATSDSYTVSAATAASAGSYDVIVTGTCGSDTSTAVSLTVNTITTITSDPAAKVVCEGSPVSFTVNASGTNLTYQWRKGTTPISGANTDTYTIPSVSIADASFYNVVVTGACGVETSANANLTVNTNTTIATEPVAMNVCSGSPAVFQVAATGIGLTYQWRKDGAPISGATDDAYSILSVGAADPANYDVVVTGACGVKTTAAVALTLKEATKINTQPDPQIICAGSTSSFTVSATGEGTLSYQWKKDGTAISGATSATLTLNNATATDAGAYTVDVTGGCGTETSIAVNLTVNAIPTAPVINTTTATTFCAGGNVLLTSTAAAGNQWFKDGTAITGETAATYTATTSGNYTVQSTQTGCTSPLSVAKAVSVTPLPAKPMITESGNVLTSSAASNNQWFLGGTAITGATASTYRVQANGAYTVQVTQNGCTNTSDVLNFTATRIDNPSAWNGEVSVYPNPVVKNLFIRNTTSRRLQVQLFDALGQKVYEGRVNGTQGMIHVEGFAGGPYQLLIIDLGKNQRISQTIIKL